MRTLIALTALTLMVVDVGSALAQPRRAAATTARRTPTNMHPTGYQVRGGTFYHGHLNQIAGATYSDPRPCVCPKVFWDRSDREGS